MSQLSDLVSKGEKLVLSNSLEISITPMTVSDEIEISNFQKQEKYIESVSYLVKSAIKRAIPDATDDEIEKLNKKDLQLITKKVLEINGLEIKEETPMKS